MLQSARSHSRGSYRGSGGSWRDNPCGSRGRGRVRAATSNWRNPPFSGSFVGIDPDVKFLNDEDVDGVSLVTDLDLTKEMQVRVGRYAHGPEDFFAANWPVSLNMTTIEMLKTTPYVASPKPVGVRYLLYIDSAGDIFMENMTQHFFRLDEDRNIHFTVKDTVLDGVIVRRKIHQDESNPNYENDEGTERKKKGRLTFVIRDATRCKGVDLTDRGILERIAFVKKHVIVPRQDYIQSQSVNTDREVFDLDVAEYKDAYLAEEYLAERFMESYKYPVDSIVFHPRYKGYVCGTCPFLLKWEKDENQECSFRLKIPTASGGSPGGPSVGDLYVVGPGRIEMLFATITLTDAMRDLHDWIIECRYADHQWVFARRRGDRKHPNGRRAVLGKLETLENPVSAEVLLTYLEGSRGLD